MSKTGSRRERFAVGRRDRQRSRGTDWDMSQAGAFAPARVTT